MTTPRLRPELHATPSEDQGVRFFDVSDPRSGGKMRLYDFEWLIAAQMDGQRSLDDIASWAKNALQLEVTGSNLRAYADHLRELGFFSLPEGPAVLPPRDPNAMSSSVTPLPPHAPTDTMSEDIALEMSDDLEDDSVTTKQEALPRHAPPTIETSKPRADERTDKNALQSKSDPQPVLGSPSTHSAGEVTAPPRSSSSSSVIGLLIVLLLIGAVVAYITLFAPSGSKVSIQVVRTGEVVALHDGSAKLDKAAPRSLAFGEAGKVTDVVATGTEMKAGMPLATLDGYAKVEKELTDVKDRLGFYQKQADAAQQRGEADAQKTAESKVAEKRKLLGDLEARAAKLRLVAPGPGTVGKVSVTAGNDAKADAPAIEVSDTRTLATFTISPDAAGKLKVGDEVALQGASGGATCIGKIIKLDGGDVGVEVADGAALKSGDEARLVKSKLAGVIVVPQGAVSKKNGADTVFVLSNGELHAKKITIADRSGADVYVSAGLTAGDQVVTSGGELADGQKASANE